MPEQTTLAFAGAEGLDLKGVPPGHPRLAGKWAAAPATAHKRSAEATVASDRALKSGSSTDKAAAAKAHRTAAVAHTAAADALRTAAMGPAGYQGDAQAQIQHHNDRAVWHSQRAALARGAKMQTAFGGDPAAAFKAALSGKQRKKLSDADFAGPDRTYPIDTIARGRNALARSAQQVGKTLTQAQADAIAAKVHKRYSSIGSDDSGKARIWRPVLRLKGAPDLTTPSFGGPLPYLTKSLAVEFEVKQEDSGKGEATHYINTFQHLDLDRDVTVKGAFAQSILEDLPLIKGLYNHDRNSLVAVPRHMEEDTKGCLVVSRFGSSQKSRDTLADIKDGLLTHCSIGFRPRPGGTEMGVFQGQRAQYLKALKLKEYSFVPFPVDEQANVVGVKSLDDISQILWQLPRAIQWLCSPEAFAELAEETILEAIDMFEDAADSLRVVAGLPPEDPPDEPVSDPELETAGGGDDEEMTAEEVAALTAAVANLNGVRDMAPRL